MKFGLFQVDDVGKTVAQISSTQDAENAATAFQDQKGEITSCSCRDRLGSSIQFYKSKQAIIGK